jgi:hypothetical protein
VGIPGPPGLALIGSVEIFDLQGDQYVLSGKINAPATARGKFGQAVLLIDGFLIVGSPGNSSTAVYIYQRNSDNTWSLVQEVIRQPGPSARSRFGVSLASSGDTLVIGDSEADFIRRASRSRKTLGSQGAAYVYKRSGGQWIYQSTLVPKPAEQHTNARFGASLSVEGNLIVVGAPGDEQGPGNVGSAFLFEENIGHQWTERAKLTSGKVGTKEYGASVFTANKLIFVGAPQTERPQVKDAGIVDVYYIDSTKTPRLYKRLRPQTAETSHYFGTAIHTISRTYFVGAPGLGRNDVFRFSPNCDEDPVKSPVCQ